MYVYILVDILFIISGNLQLLTFYHLPSSIKIKLFKKKKKTPIRALYKNELIHEVSKPLFMHDVT